MHELLPKLRLPESISSYLSDPVVRKAVDSLLAENADGLPSSLEISELASYFRARAAALAVKYDMIIVLEELWSAIWSEHLHGWSCDNEWREALDPDTVWEDRDFWFKHVRSGYEFWTAIELEAPVEGNDPELRLYCSLIRTTENVELLETVLTQFQLTDDEHDWPEWMRMERAITINASGVSDLSEAKAVAGSVYECVRRQIS